MDRIPRYLQLYFYDGQHEKENRLGVFPNLNEQIITSLTGLMDDNPYGKIFRSLKEIEVTENSKIVLSTDPATDQCVYNAPTSDKVAVVWSDNTALQGNEGPHIIAYGKGANNHRIRHFYGCYDPLQYPLLLPKDGRAESLVAAEVANAARRNTKADKRISCREYYAYKFQIRPGNLLIRGGRLFQQFIVDMYVKIENTRLDFLRLNQEAIREDLYQGILDTLELDEINACNVGKRIVLPPSFLGGPRDMRRRYLNTMALVQKYVKPDLFLTITCNPNWPEVKAELTPGELSQNRHDVVARVFHAKLTRLRKLIREKKIFGEVDAMINVVEFQKRGFAHFLIILKPGYKITSPEKFEKYPLSVHIPNGQTVRFSENEVLANVVANEERIKTMLTKFFKENMGLQEGQKYLYSEFPQHFVWNDQKKFLKPRDRGVVIGRVAHASPGEGERYYLRFLLAHVRGPQSFEDLKTVNGVCCVSF
ncbi:uncharacterized protein LOC141649439 [Silene latifolia]|uniref:uncharacterized protein LOC141649439 n=1 Tax=Silene latifolia TaxID=37657 RepID=UPI003D76C65B